MAESTWYGRDAGNEGKWMTAANWVGGVPGAGDEAICLEGSQPVTTGPTGSPTINSLWVGENFHADGGAADAYLVFGAITTSVTIIGNGHWYIDCSAAAGPSDGVVMRSTGTTGNLHLKVGTGATDLDVLRLERGTLTVEAGTVVKAIMDHRSDLQSDAHLILAAGTLTMLFKEGGRFDLTTGTVTAMESYEGTCNINGGTVTLFKIKNTVMKWHTTTTLAEGHVHSGALLDASGDPRAKIITQIYSYGTGRVDLDNGRDTITESNPTIEYGAYPTRRFTV